MYLLGRFSNHQGGVGKYYTPKIISHLLAKITTSDNQKPKTIDEPICGSGYFLFYIITLQRENNKKIIMESKI